MDGAPSPAALEQSLLLRWFPNAPGGDSTLVQHEHFSETDLRDISDVLRRVGRGHLSRIPRIYAVLKLLDRLEVIDLFLEQSISDVYFPFALQTLPQSLNPSVAHKFLELQRVVLSSALDLERETGRHRHFSSSDDVPFIKVEELGKGAYGFVDRVISTVSHREYARKLIRRGRTFQGDRKILQSFERELGTLKKLSHHRHIVQLIGSYTDPRYVGLIMSPVAECDLKDFLNSCGPDGKSNPQSRKSFMRSFFGCLTSALSYLHGNTIRHKDIKPQNVLVSQHTVYLTDFGISLDWSEVGKETTTGPTPRTARYCAPEVYDNAPRNTASDMWSLGCIFLEIWTVLKGETIADLYAFLEGGGALSSCYHLNRDTAVEWMDKLVSKPSLGDNVPQSWIRHLLIDDKHTRWTARELLLHIETVNNNIETKFAFSGQCCMEELETTESVFSSNGSLQENSSTAPILRASPSVGPSEIMPEQEERQNGPAVALRLQDDNTASYLDDNTSESLTTMLAEESIVVSPTLDALTAKIPGDESVVPVILPEAQEMKAEAEEMEAETTARQENDAQHDMDPSGGRNDQSDIAQSMLPERTQAGKLTITTSSVPTTQSISVEDAWSEANTSGADGAIFTANEASATMRVTEQARSEDSGDISAAKSDQLIMPASGLPSTVEETTSKSTTSNYGHLQQKLQRYSDTPICDSTPLASRNSWSLADQPRLLQMLLSTEDNPANGAAAARDAQMDFSHVWPLRSPEAHGIPPSTTQSLDDTLVDELERSGLSRPVSPLEAHAFSEGHSNTDGAQSPLTLSAKRRDSDAFSFQSEAEELSRPEAPKCPFEEVVPYSAPEVPTGGKRICSRCHEPIRGQFVRALGGTFHLDCFTCTDCGDIVASCFFPIPGKIIAGKMLAIANTPQEEETQMIPLCETDYFRRLDLLCRTCGKALRGSYISQLDNKYHLDHFICQQPGCNEVFGEKDSYYEFEGTVLCEIHYGRHTLCLGCATSISAQYVEIDRNGLDQIYHPECYMIEKFWKLTLKNEYVEHFTSGDLTKLLNEVDREVVKESVNKTKELMPKIYSVLSQFEESCSTSISDLLRCAVDSQHLEALSVSSQLILKIGGLLIALDQLNKAKGGEDATKPARARSTPQNILCWKIMAFFALLVDDRSQGEPKEFLASIAINIKVLIRKCLQTASSMDPHGTGVTFPTFLGNVEHAMHSDVQQRLREHDYLSISIEKCSLCQARVNEKLGQGCYLTYDTIFHIDCITCPSCNGLPTVVYDDDGQTKVECSGCNYGSMMTFISENFGRDFTILDSMLLVSVHLLWVAWAQLARTLKPKTPFSQLAMAGLSSTDVQPDDSQIDGASPTGSGNPPTCPPGLKAYWSVPAGKWCFKNVQSGNSQWECPEPGETLAIHETLQLTNLGKSKAIQELPTTKADPDRLPLKDQLNDPTVNIARSQHTSAGPVVSGLRPVMPVKKKRSIFDRWKR